MDSKFPYILDGLEAQPRSLPLLPEIKLYLLPDDLPWSSVSSSDYDRLMSQPPYWAFCWGGGQALSHWISKHPGYVSGRPVVDFGAGSGVVAIMAAKMGAGSVYAVDIDQDALVMSQHNAHLNQVSFVSLGSISLTANEVLVAADVCYEETGLEMVSAHLQRGGDVLLADSRVDNLTSQLPKLTQIAEYHVSTFPDLVEDERFSSVKVYSNFVQ